MLTYHDFERTRPTASRRQPSLITAPPLPGIFLYNHILRHGHCVVHILSAVHLIAEVWLVEAEQVGALANVPEGLQALVGEVLRAP